jgi:hypothetical protein
MSAQREARSRCLSLGRFRGPYGPEGGSGPWIRCGCGRTGREVVLMRGCAVALSKTDRRAAAWPLTRRSRSLGATRCAAHLYPS